MIKPKRANTVLSSIFAPCRARSPRRESTLCLEARLLDLLLQGADMRDASRRLVEEGEKKNAVYAAALRLKGMLREEE